MTLAPGQRVGARLLFALSAGLCALVLCPVTAHAATPVRYDVSARVDAGHKTVTGTMAVEADVAAGERSVRLWLYADRLAVVPVAMDEISARFIYPGEVDLGGIDVHDVRVDGRAVATRRTSARAGTTRGRDVAGADLLVPVAPGPRRVRITLAFRIRVPARFGRIGAVHHGLFLLGPWYPLVVGSGVQDDDAYRFVVPQHVVVEAGGEQLFVGGTLGRGRVETRAREPWLGVVVAPQLHVRTRELGGVEMRYLATRAPYDPPPPTARGLFALHDLLRIDVVDRVAHVARDSLTTLRQAALPFDHRRIDVVQMPSRTELATTAPGMVLVSDRLYEVFPIEPVLAFHDRSLRRALFRHLVHPVGEAVEAPKDRDWADEVRAVVLEQLDEARHGRSAVRPSDLVGWAAFQPSVAQLLYAPQIAFVYDYFGTVAGADRFRDDPARARFPMASGRRIVASARDALGPERFRRFARLLLDPHLTVRAALAEVAPELSSRLDTWLAAPTLAVNYRLGHIDSHRLPDGRWRHHICIVREGAHRPEPVTVEVRDDEGHTRRVRWPGLHDRGAVDVVTRGRLDNVVLDPDLRLPESPALTDGHPRTDDALHQPWRLPLLRDYAVSLSLPEGVSGLVDVALRRRYDLEHTIDAFFETVPSQTGGALSYIAGVGPKATTNRRIGYLSGAVDFYRLHKGFVAGGQGGYRLGVALAAGLETRRYFSDPRTGHSLAASLHLGGVRHDDGSYALTGNLEVRGSVTVPIGLLQALVLIGGGGVTFGPALPAERQFLGSRYILRGFQSDELVGDASVYGIVEHRWTVATDMSWNFLHLAWLRELQLAVFGAGGAIIGPLGGHGIEGAAEVGAGVRFHFTYGGIQPGVLAIDVARPLTRKTDAIVNGNGEVIGHRPPVGVYISFDRDNVKPGGGGGMLG